MGSDSEVLGSALELIVQICCHLSKNDKGEEVRKMDKEIVCLCSFMVPSFP